MTAPDPRTLERLASLERTVRGAPDEAHDGLIGYTRQNRRLLYAILAVSTFNAGESLLPALLELISKA